MDRDAMMVVGLGIAIYVFMRSDYTPKTKKQSENEVAVSEKKHAVARKHEPKVMQATSHDPGPTVEEKERVRKLMKVVDIPDPSHPSKGFKGKQLDTYTVVTKDPKTASQKLVHHVSSIF